VAFNFLSDEPREFFAVNGKRVAASPDKFGYVSIDRLWKNGDIVDVDLPVEVRKVVADQRVKDTRRRMAVERGPIVYCAEWPDVEGGKLLGLLVDPKSELKAQVDKGLFGGVTVIATEARSITNPTLPAKPVKLIPYYLWANRGAGEMTVWLSTGEYAIGDVGPAGGLILYDNPNYAKDGWRYLEAARSIRAPARRGLLPEAIEGAAARPLEPASRTRKTCWQPVQSQERGAAVQHVEPEWRRGWFLPRATN
jgi:hypothetical protein